MGGRWSVRPHRPCRGARATAVCHGKYSRTEPVVWHWLLLIKTIKLRAAALGTAHVSNLVSPLSVQELAEQTPPRTRTAGARWSLRGARGHVSVQRSLRRREHAWVRQRGAGCQRRGHEGTPWVRVGQSTGAAHGDGDRHREVLRWQTGLEGKNKEEKAVSSHFSITQEVW